MNKISYITSYLFCILLFSGPIRHSFAQEPLNLAFLNTVPQSFRMNPACNSDYQWWIGMPALSGIHAGFENSGFRYKDVAYRTADDSLHIDIDGFLNSLQAKNTLSLELQTELLAFGFHIRKYYIDVRFSNRSSTAFNYSRDLMDFLFKLNGQYINKEASFSGSGLNISLFNEASVGICRPINKNLRTGVRIKLLSGIFNIYSKKTNISLFTDEALAYKLTLRSDIEINTSIPGLIVDPSDFLNFTFDYDKLADNLTHFNNPGVGLDMGAQYTLNEKFLLGLSITDLGFISWSNNTTNYVSNKEKSEFSFEGIDLHEFFNNDTLSFSTQIDEVLDSLKNSLGINTIHKTYTSPLLTRFNLTGEFTLTPRIHFGALLRLDMLNTKTRPSLCFNYNHQLGRWLQFMAGYSISEGNYVNLGLGYSLKLGAFELYMITDNAYAFLVPKDFKSTNFMFGLNFCFGKNKDQIQ